MTDKYVLKELCRYKLGTFADIVYRNALLRSEEEAFVSGAERVSFAKFNERVNSLVHAIYSLGVKKGDVIGIASWNCLEYTYFCGAAMKGGFVASPFNPRLHKEELEYLINYSEAKTLFVGPELIPVIKDLRSRLPSVKNYISIGSPASDMLFHDELLSAYPSNEPDVNINRDDPLIIFYTSGTTGVPRGALYTHFRKLDNTRIKALEMGAKPGDRHLMVLPFFHIGGDSHVWPFFIVGGCNVIMLQKSFDPAAVLKTIEDEKITDMQIVPTQLNSLLSLPNLRDRDLSSLNRIYYAASPMPVELLRKGLDIFGSIFSQGYGQTESGPQICSLPRKAHQVLDRSAEEQEVLSSCGQPSLGVHVRVVDEKNNDVAPGTVGEIIAKSDSIMVEYWHRPQETSEVLVGGWLHTGDLGYYDEKGFIYIVDRKKDMIVTGGENVYSREVEDILYKHKAIAEVAVVGIPDPLWVERVHAAIVLKSGTTATQEEIITFCKKHLASYKAPKSVEFLEALPKNAQGKILKREIVKKYKTANSPPE
ncbi:MAG: long-chain-fatty-acid--CoA ligase [Deltaproteobacteria bacterium]|nr:long-chain-fatty-acid--CoA ligase [Deltaproteobacteria bacterium]MBW1976533.1 long-chain-fatty-acid--CoA ligase [Deltaproteobacteria bacterium]MBW2043770.1 long-chain-fatty-acid--CoA ligase [Deltaproteobacteria bacterium]MBW2298713.1 long-chain-fatty-acid--CoA ligase [Deltaproteobacteria bacterium]RLB35544.1 MAG: long-chain fatty acid--CoA ligase [Deltaproteobacteria bacterium]